MEVLSHVSDWRNIKGYAKYLMELLWKTSLLVFRITTPTLGMRMELLWKAKTKIIGITP